VGPAGRSIEQTWLSLDHPGFPIEIDGGHCPHVAGPEALAAILTSITSIEH